VVFSLDLSVDRRERDMERKAERRESDGKPTEGERKRTFCLLT